MSTPKITNIKRHNGIAGQFSYTANVRYPNEDTTTIEFVGNSFGGAPILIMGNGSQVYVRFSDRFTDFSKLNPQWVRDFFIKESFFDTPHEETT